ncbi:hypothetical protein TorRG33x02_152750, partial [Trema orientale]
VPLLAELSAIREGLILAVAMEFIVHIFENNDSSTVVSKVNSLDGLSEIFQRETGGGS